MNIYFSKSLGRPTCCNYPPLGANILEACVSSSQQKQKRETLERLEDIEQNIDSTLCFGWTAVLRFSKPDWTIETIK